MRCCEPRFGGNAVWDESISLAREQPSIPELIWYMPLATAIEQRIERFNVGTV